MASGSSNNNDNTQNNDNNNKINSNGGSTSTNIKFIRWLESHNLGDYASALSLLGVDNISSLLSLTHSQLIEVGRQLGMKNIRCVMFTELIVNNLSYLKRDSINEALLIDEYKLYNLLKKLETFSIRDNWDNITEDIYALIDECANIRTLISSIEETLIIDKNNYIAWDINGLINAKRGFLADARVSFQRSLVKNPNYLHARFNHARLLHFELKEYQTAKLEYECIIKIKPNFSKAYNAYALLMETLGDDETAEKYYRRGIQLRPKSISYRHNLANLLSKNNRYLLVQQVYQESVRQHPKSATLRLHHALSLVKCRYNDEAEMEFKNAIKLNNSNGLLYYEYAKYCERHKNPPNYKKATDLYFRATSCDPINFLHAIVDAANLMRRLDTNNSKQSAELLFNKLIIDAPHLNKAWLGYSKLLWRQKNLKKAQQIAKNGLIHHPNDNDLKKYLSFLLKQSANTHTVHQHQSRPSILYSNQQSTANHIQTNSNNQELNQLIKNMSFDPIKNINGSNISLSMSEDINTPPLPIMYNDNKRSSSSLPRRYSKRSKDNQSPHVQLNDDDNDEKINNNNINNHRASKLINKHRHSIKNNKFNINGNAIFNTKNNINKQRRNSLNKHSSKYAAAPRTSNQFHPQNVKKRQSQLNTLPTITQQQPIKPLKPIPQKPKPYQAKPKPKPKPNLNKKKLNKKSVSAGAVSSSHKKKIIVAANNNNPTRSKDDASCLIM